MVKTTTRGWKLHCYRIIANPRGEHNTTYDYTAPGPARRDGRRMAARGGYRDITLYRVTGKNTRVKVLIWDEEGREKKC